MTEISYRKRSREDEQNDGEFFPLSKRINNLHLSPMINNNFTPAMINPPPEAQHQNFHHSAMSPTAYSPDLKQHENPHYYETNKVLYELYTERLQREAKML